MPELLIHGAAGESRLPFSGSPLLTDLIESIPDAPGKPCGGGGNCGKCAVFASGSLSPSPDQRGMVLSCQTRLTGDAEIWLPPRQSMKQIEADASGQAYPLSPIQGHYAAAVDIGTTTVVLRLLDLQQGRILSTMACENPQRTIAHDVIGRIDGALKGRLPLLYHLIRNAVDQLEADAIKAASLSIAMADFRVITGNTTMLYLFTGRDPEPLSHAPFEADCLFGHWEGRDYFPACAGAFVGADITCALLFSGICTKDETALLIDIGTNGEIALWHKGIITCCATAAGPAFEGGGIECGTGSILGAIDSVRAEDDAIRFSTIGGNVPTGICGSGLIDLTAALLELEWMDESGILDKDDIRLSDDVYLTQKDIRQIQLAKGAIAAGMQTLVREAGIAMSDVQTLYIAGGFGSHLNLKSAARIGLIPPCLADRTVVLGNAALGGAQRLLLNQESMDQINHIAQRSDCVNLGGSPAFTDAFVECMMFE